MACTRACTSAGCCFTRNNQRAALIFLQIPYYDVQPFLRGRRKCAAAAEAQLGGEGAGELLNFKEAKREAVIRAGAGDRGRGLDHVQTVHFAGAIDFGKLIELPAAVKLFHVADMTGSAGEKIGVER